VGLSLRRWLRSRAELEPAQQLYARIVGQARHPSFYESSGVPDTADGRFDMVALHAFLVLRRLRRDPQSTKSVAQDLFDVMFADMDENLREMGVGDLGVGRRVKGMAKGFYGRIGAYDAGLDDAGDDALRAALTRNLFRGTTPDARHLDALTAYVRRADKHLAALPVAGLCRGEVTFPPPVSPGDLR